MKTGSYELKKAVKILKPFGATTSYFSILMPIKLAVLERGETDEQGGEQ